MSVCPFCLSICLRCILKGKNAIFSDAIENRCLESTFYINYTVLQIFMNMNTFILKLDWIEYTTSV